MAYRVSHIQVFGGLNSNVHPDLIADGEFRNLVNWRQGHVGKLVVRNGQIIGLVAGNELASEVLAQNFGCVGIGELVLSGVHEAFDTDRFMVYALIRYNDDGPNTFGYILSPFSAHANPLSNTTYGAGVLASELIFMKAIPANALDDSLTFELGTNEVGANGPGIAGDHHVEMAQLARRLIVTDSHNGDLVFIDRTDMQQDQCSTQPHQIELRANTLDRFNIDIVSLDDRTGAGEENFRVRHPMALYGYRLPKHRTKGTVDRFTPLFRNLNPDLATAAREAFELVQEFHDNSLLTVACFATDCAGAYALPGGGTYTSVEVRVNGAPEQTVIFSNADADTEFDNVLGKLMLHEDEFTYTEEDERGVPITKTAHDRAADVYLWRDFEVDYYPSSGVAPGHRFLRDLDRQFDKLEPGAPKVRHLSVKTYAGKQAPLSVWAYRFVWEYDNNEFSAPSTPLMCPDCLFSAVPDEDLIDYQRYTDPLNLDTDTAGEGYAQTADILLDERFFGHRTRILELVHALKTKLYLPDHRYGAQQDDLATCTDEEKARIMTLITGRFPETVTMKGIIAQAAIVNQSPPHYRELDLRVPMFNSGPSYTYNAVFTDGKYRRSWTRRQLVLIGENAFCASTVSGSLGYDLNDGDTSTKWRFVDNGSLWLNFTPLDAADQNNQIDINTSGRKRTLLRGVSTDTDSLLNIRGDIDTRALSRLILPGTLELRLVRTGEYLHFTPTTTPYNPDRDILDYTDVRQNYVMHSVRFTGSRDNPVAAPTIHSDALVNVEVTAYGEGVRFTGIEQLTNAIPASLLFGAPRVRLHIAAETIPARARRLHIFRTMSSHHNNWQPDIYGLVAEVDVQRTEGIAGDVVFFDIVEDRNLNFLRDIDQYEGLDTPLKSRHIIVADNRAFYLNYRETYQPPKPRET